MNLWQSISGMIIGELTSAEPENALSAINEAGIALHNLQKTGELSFRFRVKRRDYPQVEKLCEKRGETVAVVERNGLYWTGIQLLRRPVICCTVIFSIFLSLFLSSRILFIRVEGNGQIPENQIREAAQLCGICFGASRREVRSERVKNALLSAVPELQWAGVNTSGCVAVISVRERPEQAEEDRAYTVSRIVADRDGYILSATATGGNLLVNAGQTVREGQTLISGYRDCGLLIQASRAEGEVMARTNRDLQVSFWPEYGSRGGLLDTKRKYSLLIRKKRINLWKDSGISDSSCGRMYEEYYVTLPGGFRLPFAVCVDTYLVYDQEPMRLSQDRAEALLDEYARTYLTKHMIAGTVQDSETQVTEENGVYCQTGNYGCTEMIGRERQEQIGEFDGKNG